MNFKNERPTTQWPQWKDKVLLLSVLVLLVLVQIPSTFFNSPKPSASSRLAFAQSVERCKNLHNVPGGNREVKRTQSDRAGAKGERARSIESN